jgi:hypothetical protein
VASALSHGATDESQVRSGRRTSNLREFDLGAGPDDELKRRFWS